MIISKCKKLTQLSLPDFTGKIGDQLYMIPFKLNDLNKIPNKWKLFIESIKNYMPNFKGYAYLTVDQKFIPANKKHRRGGMHIDGNYDFCDWGGGGWLNGKSGINLSPENFKKSYLEEGLGTLIISNYSACKIWEGIIDDIPSMGGGCEHLKDKVETLNSYLLECNMLYWISSQCIHESLIIKENVKRTLCRITLPKE